MHINQKHIQQRCTFLILCNEIIDFKKFAIQNEKSRYLHILLDENKKIVKEITNFAAKVHFYYTAKYINQKHIHQKYISKSKNKQKNINKNI